MEINAIIPYETNGNDYDVTLVFFTSGPSTPDGYYDLAMPNYPQSVDGALFGTNSIKTTGGQGMYNSNLLDLCADRHIQAVQCHCPGKRKVHQLPVCLFFILYIVVVMLIFFSNEKFPRVILIIWILRFLKHK